MKLSQSLAVLVQSPLRLLLSSLTLIGTTLLAAAPAPAQTFFRPLTFEHNRGQAPREVKWLGRSSTYRALFEGSGATFLHRDENATRAMSGQQPVPVNNLPDPNSHDRGTSHDDQVTPKSRRLRRKLPRVEGTTSAGRSLSSGPQTPSDGGLSGPSR
jgi:hypothetical protein